MKELTARQDISDKELKRGKRLKAIAIGAPLALAISPAVIFLLLLFLFGASPPTAAIILFLGFLFTIAGLLTGLVISGISAYRYSNWTKEMRERIASKGIRAEEIEWFRHELRTSEKKALKNMSRRDLLLADAYRETLASRLTATRIAKSSKSELLLVQRRQSKLKYLKSAKSEQFREQLGRDFEKLSSINTEARQMLAEAESRLQMIEAASMRGTTLADSELALKKLSARSAELPLALESAKMEEEIRKELEATNQ